MSYQGFFLHLLLLAICRSIWVRSLTTKSAKFCSSYSRMQGPGICLWFSDRSNWSHWSFEATVLRCQLAMTLTLANVNLSLYIMLYFYCWLYNYAAQFTDIFYSDHCPTRCRQSRMRFLLSPLLLLLRLLYMLWSDIPFFPLTHNFLEPHICVGRLPQHWFRSWLVACSAPSHYLHRCWLVVNCTPVDKFQWHWNGNYIICIKIVRLKMASVEIAAILSRGN